MDQNELENALNTNQTESVIHAHDLTDGERMVHQLVQLTSEVGATDKHFELEEVIHGIRNGYFLSNYEQDDAEPLVRRLQSKNTDN